MATGTITDKINNVVALLIGVGRVDPGRAVVAVAFLQEGREDRPVVPAWGVADHGSPQTSSGRCPLEREVFRLSP